MAEYGDESRSRMYNFRNIDSLLLLVVIWLLHPWARFILPWPAPRQMSSFYEFRIVHHPEASKVVLVTDKALVQGQVCADGVLAGAGGEIEIS